MIKEECSMAKIMIYPSKYVQGPGEIGKLGAYAEGDRKSVV